MDSVWKSDSGIHVHRMQSWKTHGITWGNHGIHGKPLFFHEVHEPRLHALITFYRSLSRISPETAYAGSCPSGNA